MFFTNNYQNTVCEKIQSSQIAVHLISYNIERNYFCRITLIILEAEDAKFYFFFKFVLLVLKREQTSGDFYFIK